MANEVYANGLEVACKAAAGQSVCAFPDVCLSPPTPPAGPVPLPYPVTGFAKDTTNGSTSVQISGKEILLKNQSYLSKCTGDEAATQGLPKGVVTHALSGKVYFQAWSMDVKVEGKNVTRHFDITTHNHMSMPGDTPTWPYLDMLATDMDGPCVADQKKEYEACKDKKPHKADGKDACDALDDPKPVPPDFADCSPDLNQADIGLLSNNVKLPSMARTDTGRLSKDRVDELKKKYKKSDKYKAHRRDVEKYYDNMEKKSSEDPCLRARRCMLVPFKPEGKQTGCCEGKQTGHHLVEASSFFTRGRGNTAGARRQPGCKGYDTDAAPCICVEGNSQNIGSHGLMHSVQSHLSGKKGDGGKQSFQQATNTATTATNAVFPESKCNPACIKAQLDNYHRTNCEDLNARTKVKAVSTGDASEEASDGAKKAAEDKMQSMMDRGLLGPRPTV